jgi:hypothetical protein
MRLTVGNTTLATTTGLLGSFITRVFCVDFAKVLLAQIWGSLFGHIPINLRELQHLLASHAPSSRIQSEPLFKTPLLK